MDAEVFLAVPRAGKVRRFDAIEDALEHLVLHNGGVLETPGGQLDVLPVKRGVA